MEKFCPKCDGQDGDERWHEFLEFIEFLPACREIARQERGLGSLPRAMCRAFRPYFRGLILTVC